MSTRNQKHFSGGFTIVELMVVIIIIGILSAITLVSYNGIQNRATNDSLQSDLNNAADLLRIDQAHSSTGVFPATLAAADSGKGVKASSGTTLTYTVNNTNNPRSFCITATSTKSLQSYSINQEGTPLAGVCPVQYFDAGALSSYPGTGTTLTDLSGNGYNGTLVNGVTYSTNYSGTLNFDGASSYVNAGNLGAFYNQGTISLWINPSVIENYRNPFTTNYNGGVATNASIRFEETTVGGFTTVIGNDGGSYTGGTYLATGLTANTWYHVVLVWDKTSNNIKGYLNGVNKFNQTQTYWPSTMPSVTIGEGFDITRYWKGSIAVVGIYNQAMSASDILQNFNALRSRYGL